MSDSIPTFPISHPEHGKAVCDDRQWPEFEAAGWKRVKAPKPEASDAK